MLNTDDSLCMKVTARQMRREETATGQGCVCLCLSKICKSMCISVVFLCDSKTWSVCGSFHPCVCLFIKL